MHHVLLLSCNTGEGHNSCARALEEYYLMMGDTCQITDALAFVSQDVSKLISKGHVLMYRKFSGLCEWGYQYAQKHRESLDERSTLYRFFSKGVKALYAYIGENGFDQIICTHPFAAVMASELRRRCGLQIPIGFISTDYSCCPGVETTNLDVYFIPDALLTGEFEQCGIPKEKLCASGMPVGQSFYSHRPPVDAKRLFGITPDHSHIVMACGSMGCGPMEELAQILASRMGDRVELSVVCGTNAHLRESMEKQHENHPCVHVLGYVQEMSALLDSADVYVTKPGGLSISEAKAKGTFMVLVNVVGGCEKYNLIHMLSSGCAITGDTPEELAEQCMQAAQRGTHGWAPDGINAAKVIYETMDRKGIESGTA